MNKKFYFFALIAIFFVPVVTFASESGGSSGGSGSENDSGAHFTYAFPQIDVPNQRCESIVQSYQMNNCDQSCKENIRKSVPDCFFGVEAVSSTTFVQINTISNVVSSRFFPKWLKASAKGMSSGSENPRWNAWGNLTNNDTDQKDYARDFNSSILTTVVGGDYALSPGTVVGVSLSFDNGDGSINGADMESSGYSVAPYFGIQLNQNFVLDVSFGFGAGELDTAGNTKDESDRFFGAANLSYSSWIDNIQLTSKLSYLHGRESYDNTKINGISIAGTEEENRITQMRAGFQAGYWMERLMPYAGLTYSTDISRSSKIAAGDIEIGPRGFIFELGMNFFSLANGITGGIAYSREEGRTNQENNMVVANISVRF